MQITPFDKLSLKVNAKTDDFLYLLAKELNIDIPEQFTSIISEIIISETYDEKYNGLVELGKTPPQESLKETIVEEVDQKNLLLNNIRSFNLSKLKRTPTKN